MQQSIKPLLTLSVNAKLEIYKKILMEKNKLSELTDEELLIEKKKLKKRKIINALIIGFLAGIVAVGIVSWSLGARKNLIAFLIPMLFPMYFIYRIIKNSKKDKELENVLKERNIK
ncbi:hypothetical protein [uncultured Aquimarina sp.]|uniref:hypothetical protein n=1 Tax=uncultured Aquimarina sp. TaxID=575652 RepID=UPI0026088F49|nr:hypothetical protein [uncultured Aquimarina sp.]